jgi:hypothetical protein
MNTSNTSITNNMSASERLALAHFATLPQLIVPMQSFQPRVTPYYRDGAGTELWGKPDALAKQPESFTFIESKNGCLNSHPSRQSCHRALELEYAATMHDGRPKEYNELTAHFRHANFPFLLANSWNNSLYKVLALQLLHGFGKYVVVFAKSPSYRDAERYSKAGLVWCTNDSLARMLATIELAANGVYVPFHYRAPRAKYHIVINPEPNPAHAGLSPDEIEAANRIEYETTLAHDPAIHYLQ